MSERLYSLEITLQEVRTADFRIENLQLSPQFFSNSAYFGCQDLWGSLNLLAHYVGTPEGEGTYYLSIHLTGTGVFECCRCLKGVRVPLSFDGELEVRTIAEGKEKFDDEPWQVLASREKLELGDYLRESLYLSFPMGVAHGDFDSSVEDCDPEMLAYLLKEDRGVSLGTQCGAQLAQLGEKLAREEKERIKKEES